jgi:hypothetical protein
VPADLDLTVMLVQQLVNIADGFVVQTVVESLPHFISEH